MSRMTTLQSRQSTLPRVVVRRFDRHLDVVRVALGQAGGRDLDQLPALVQLVEGGRADEPHAGAQSADELVRHGRQRAAVGSLAPIPFGYRLAVAANVSWDVLS